MADQANPDDGAQDSVDANEEPTVDGVLEAAESAGVLEAGRVAGELEAPANAWDTVETYDATDGTVFYDSENPLAWVKTDQSVPLSEMA